MTTPTPQAKPSSVAILINANAGTFLHQDGEALTASLREVCREEGVEATLKVVPPASMGEELARTLDARPDAIFLGGGDGTISHSLEALLQADIPLGVLPLGTMNMLARDLDIPLDPCEALRLSLQGECVRIDVSQVNDKPFLNRFTVGFYPTVVREWQKTKERRWPVRAFLYMRLFLRYLLRSKSTNVRILEGEHHEILHRTNMVVVSNNPYEEASILPVPRRKSMQRGCLALYISKHRSLWSYLKLFWLALLGRWRDDRQLEILQAQEFQLRLAKRPERDLPVSIDGDLYHLDQPLIFRIHLQALPVLKPLPPPQEKSVVDQTLALFS